MRKSPHRALLLVAVFAAPLAIWGCKDQARNPPPTQTGPPPEQGPRGNGDRPARLIMTRIGKGPNALDGMLKRELQTDQPDWAIIQPQAAEYARLAADLGKAEPTKGSKESWAKQTAAFVESATALDKAAQARDLSAARASQEKLGASCMQCHREHRGGPGGPGGFGPPGKRGSPPPGPPPG
jgi:cytochrome c556